MKNEICVFGENMKELENLFSLFQSLKEKGGAKININIPACGETYFDCVRLNEMMGDCSDFNFRGLLQPHVTIKMGEVESLDDLACILDILETCVSNFSCETLSPKPVILKKPDEKYYFCEIENENLMKMSRLLDKKLERYMKQPHHPLDENNLHHITIGYRTGDMPICEKVLNKEISAFKFDRICVTMCGNHGVSFGTIKNFMLKQ